MTLNPHPSGVDVERSIRPMTSQGLWALHLAAATWWAVAIVGHLLFAAYILGTYGKATLHDDAAAWNRVWPAGYLAAQPVGNLIVAIHVLLASVVSVCGPLQLLPHVRRRLPWFHRWNGRVYITTAIIVGLAGLAMLATDRGFTGASQNGNVALNGFLMLICATLAWRHARARNFVAHRRWALRLLVLAAGVWFFRIGLATWIALNDGIVGFDPRTMQGAALWVLACGEWLVPLTVLQAYFRAEKAQTNTSRYAVAAFLLLSALVTGYGIYRASIGMWLPALHGNT